MRLFLGQALAKLSQPLVVRKQCRVRQQGVFVGTLGIQNDQRYARIRMIFQRRIGKGEVREAVTNAERDSLKYPRFTWLQPSIKSERGIAFLPRQGAARRADFIHEVDPGDRHIKVVRNRCMEGVAIKDRIGGHDASIKGLKRIKRVGALLGDVLLDFILRWPTRGQQQSQQQNKGCLHYFKPPAAIG